MGVIRIGIIGVGGMAQSHIKGLQNVGTFKIEAICDSNRVRLKKVGEQLAIKTENQYQDFRELIDSQKIDAVVSVTPNNVHAPILEYCMERKMPILTEKPFTLDYEEAQQLAEKYKKQPIPCMVGFSYRYTPAFRFVKVLLEKGEIGQIRNFSIQYLQGWGAPSYQTPYMWRFNPAITGTGVLGDLGSHMIDMAHYLFGPFQEVSAILESFITKRKLEHSNESKEFSIDDFASFQARMENGIIGTFQTTRNAIGSGNQHEIAIFGDKGTLHASTKEEDIVYLIQVNEETGELVEKKMHVPKSVYLTEWEDFSKMLNGEVRLGFPDFMTGVMNQQVLEAIRESSRVPGKRIAPL
ncbi:Gfo/Idh/MocA family oxidoreductase [Niallia circulans]|uniref:Gfo/Idh/MocA family protein n=1 Tax=Niallia circulans TaxID=1397 RepID=UPI00203E2287|nr:Gfo/Idh/MocA family oxidoreductase [Niallia circulans]MCM2979494.1 Gfo/Idh/MocA family oxidoreductase [Niallia circulans]